MNPKVQIPRLKKHLEWLLYQAIVTRQTFNATYAVGKMLYKTEVLLTYGDYFARILKIRTALFLGHNPR